MSRSLAVFGALLWWPGMALAHSPIKGLENFYAGLLHPLLVPAHLLTVLVLGILIGQQRLQLPQPAVIAFLLATFAGLAATLWLGETAVEIPLLAGAALSGILVTLAWPLPQAACVALAAALGLMIGLDSGQDALAGRSRWAALLGSGIAAYLLLLYAMVFAGFFSRHDWQRIGLRVLGSWGTASALLVLSLAAVR